MREILFRGIPKFEFRKWAEGYYYQMVGSPPTSFIRDVYGNDTEVFPETVGQFSGMCDKNGVKIFEGDIIQITNADHKHICAVCKYGIARRVVGIYTLDIPCFYFEMKDGFKSFPIVNNYEGKHDLELFEVVGSIHQRSEAKIYDILKDGNYETHTRV